MRLGLYLFTILYTVSHVCFSSPTVLTIKDGSHNEQPSEETEDEHIEFWSSKFEPQQFSTLSELFSLFLPESIEIRDVSDLFNKKNFLRERVSGACDSVEYKDEVLEWNDYLIARALTKFIDDFDKIDEAIDNPQHLLDIVLSGGTLDDIGKKLVDLFIEGYGPAVAYIKHYRWVSEETLKLLHKYCSGMRYATKERRQCSNTQMIPNEWKPFPLIDCSSKMYIKAEEAMKRGDYYLMRIYEAMVDLAKLVYEMRYPTVRPEYDKLYLVMKNINFYAQKERKWKDWKQVSQIYSKAWDETRPLTLVLEYLCDDSLFTNEYKLRYPYGTDVFNRCLQYHLSSIESKIHSVSRFKTELRHYEHVVNFHEKMMRGNIPVNPAKPEDMKDYITLGLVFYGYLKPKGMSDDTFFKSFNISINSIKVFDGETTEDHDYEVAVHALVQYEKLRENQEHFNALRSVCRGLPNVPKDLFTAKKRIDFVLTLLEEFRKCRKLSYINVNNAFIYDKLIYLFEEGIEDTE